MECVSASVCYEWECVGMCVSVNKCVLPISLLLMCSLCVSLHVLHYGDGMCGRGMLW